MSDPVMHYALYLTHLKEEIKYLNTRWHPFENGKRLLQEECDSIRHLLYSFDEFAIASVDLPKGTGQKIYIEKKIYFQTGFLNFNWVGRLIGPKGETIKQLQRDTQCRLIIHGIKKKFPYCKGQPRTCVSNLAQDKDPYLLVSITTYENIAYTLLERAVNHVMKVLNPTISGVEFYRLQMIHNAIINNECLSPQISQFISKDMQAQNMFDNSMLNRGFFFRNIRKWRRDECLVFHQANEIYSSFQPHKHQHFSLLNNTMIKKQLSNKAQYPPLGSQRLFHTSSSVEAQKPNYQFHSSQDSRLSDEIYPLLEPKKHDLSFYQQLYDQNIGELIKIEAQEPDYQINPSPSNEPRELDFGYLNYPPLYSSTPNLK